MFYSAEHKRKDDILKNFSDQTVGGPIDFHVGGKYFGSQSVWSPTSFKISSFVFSRKQKFIRLKQLEF